MRLDTGDVPKHFLLPCTIFAHWKEHWVTTILGSCISVCLWDPEARVGGINHFMLPLWNGEGLATPRFGNIAIDKLIDRMEALQAGRGRMVAKVFGGAKVIRGDASPFSVGERNAMLAQEMLATRGLPVVASETGGSCGMKIHFNTRSGQVLLARLSSEAQAAPNLPDGRPEAALARLKGLPALS